MSFITGMDRAQTLLLPESLEDYVSTQHPVRFLDAFVEGLDLATCGFARTEAAETGRPPFAPGDLLKLYLWGYLNKVRSSRRLELECGRNLEVLWLLRKLRPDFKTIADFRKENAAAFKKVFRQFHLLCRDLGLFGAEVVAIDGTKLKAVNNVARNFTPQKLRASLGRIDARLAEFLAALDAGDGADAPPSAAAAAPVRGSLEEKIAVLRERQQRYQEALQGLEESGATQVSLTDPDSRRMRKVGVGYNAQIAVDARHKLIAAAEVTNEPTDHGQLAPMAAAAKEALGVEKLQAVADGGYYDHGQIAACAEIGVESYVPRPRKGSAEAGGRFGKEQFTYEASSDTYRCPEGHTLWREVEWLKRGEPHLAYANPEACRACPHQAQCTTAPYRRITRWAGEAVVEAMHARVAAHPEMIAQRKAIVEHPFGSIKFWQEQRTFMMRGLEKVRGEFHLSALAYNMKRVINIVGMERLLEAVRKFAVAAARLLGAFLETLYARWHREEAEWPLAA
jgi:transposase